MTESVVLTRISQTKRGRWALFCEEGFLFSVDEETMASRCLCVDDALSPAELESLKEQSDAHKAKEQALRYLGRRCYARQELYQKLCLKFDEYTAQAAVDVMQDVGLLDDYAYAVERAQGLAAKRKSRLEIERQLRVAGVDADVLRQAMQEAAPCDEETAYTLAAGRYAARLANGEERQVMAALARRGFAHRDIRAAVQRAQEELAAEDFETE